MNSTKPPFAGTVAATMRIQQSLLAAATRTARLWTQGPTASSDDPRFADPSWNRPDLAFARTSFGIWSDLVEDSADALAEIDPQLGLRSGFVARQVTDAMCPVNSPMLNPEVVRETARTRGRNLLRGAANALGDLRRGRISHVREDAFELGRDLAATPGDVVLRTDLAEIIQYRPTTDSVSDRPILMIPPWINKYYILDLSQRNSMVRHLVDAGYTVFMISWRNPSGRHRSMGWEDYMILGPLAAMDAIGDITGAEHIHLVGYCLGGLMLQTVLAHLADIGDRRPASATFFTTPQDFSDPGAVAPFLGPDGVALMELVMEANGGFLDGRNMTATFNSVRGRDLIWPYVISNYWLGRDPKPVDFLYWNQDSTRIPARVHSYLVRRIFREDLLTRPGRLQLLGSPMDLGRIDLPTFAVATEKDHVVPWQSAHRMGALLGGPVRFVLGESGHVAGVINPPEGGRRGYWTGDDAERDPEAWMSSATHHSGSWWPEWLDWLEQFNEADVDPPATGSRRHPALCDAPGTYVVER
jgi:polyhydroxyalkanoate synthase